MIKTDILKKIEYWEIPVEWKIRGDINVPKFEATTAKEALEVAKSMLETCQLPENDEFMEKSVEINEDLFMLQESITENSAYKKAVYRNGASVFIDIKIQEEEECRRSYGNAGKGGNICVKKL